MRKVLFVPLILVVLAAVGVIGAYFVRYSRAPRVTLINASGRDVFDVELRHGNVVTPVPALRFSHATTVEIHGEFSESGTRVSWSDSLGAYSDGAEDYVENIGFYHSRVVLVPGGTVTAIYGID